MILKIVYLTYLRERKTGQMPLEIESKHMNQRSKPLIERLPLLEHESFAARIHTTPQFEVPLHQHEEIELLGIRSGEGIFRMGNYVGNFRAGDVYIVGGKIPHSFSKKREEDIVSAAVVHFNPAKWGDVFLQLPENRNLTKFFQQLGAGIQLKSALSAPILTWMEQLAIDNQGKRLAQLLLMLQQIADSKEKEFLHSHPDEAIPSFNWRDQERMDAVYRFTMTHFREKIQLTEVAATAGMTVPAFCNYFKKRTKKTYVDFLNEIRIGFAGRLLAETNCSVLEACHSAGFNNVAHFNRQFRKWKNTSPMQFKKHFQERDIQNEFYTGDNWRILE